MKAAVLGSIARHSRAARSTAGSAPFRTAGHVIEVEIDDATDAVALVRYYAVEDVGPMSNPLLVAGRHCEPKTKQSSSACSTQT